MFEWKQSGQASEKQTKGREGGNGDAEPPIVYLCELEPDTDETARPALRRAAKAQPKAQPWYGPSRCSSPAYYADLPDGLYKFSMRAGNAVNTFGPAACRTFRINTVMPDIRSPDVPAVVADDTFKATLAVTDLSPGGGGALAAECCLHLLAKAGEEGKPSENGTWTPCVSPAIFGPGLEDGRWGLTLRAADSAGNVRVAEEVTLFVDRMPPTGRIVSGPGSFRPAPSAVSMSFAEIPDS